MFLERHGATRAQRYVIVLDDEEFDAMAILRAARTHAGLEAGGAYRGDARAVAEPLRALGFDVDDLRAATAGLDTGYAAVGTLGGDPATYVGRRPPQFSGPTDAWTVRTARREQRWLTSALGIRTGNPDQQHQCGLCGHQRPERLLIAAHIKPRSVCSEAERAAFLAVAIPACLLGCDALYEHGYISIDSGGRILAADNAHGATPEAEDLRGRFAPAWTTLREPHFAWHRQHRFLDHIVIT